MQYVRPGGRRSSEGPVADWAVVVRTLIAVMLVQMLVFYAAYAVRSLRG